MGLKEGSLKSRKFYKPTYFLGNSLKIKHNLTKYCTPMTSTRNGARWLSHDFMTILNLGLNYRKYRIFRLGPTNCHKILSKNEICPIFSGKHGKMNYNKSLKVCGDSAGPPNCANFTFFQAAGTSDRPNTDRVKVVKSKE